jgi:hypothetical protein
MSLNSNRRSLIQSNHRFVRYSYLFSVFILVLTGFGQMPIFKRYYIADIPGLGWLAQFYVTHYVHYLGAVIFIALSTYIVADYLAIQRKFQKITFSGYLRLAILTGILVSGVFLVLRNLAGYTFSPGFIILLDLSHLGLVMILLMVALYCSISKKRWTTSL